MSSMFRTPMALAPITSSTEIVDPSAGHGGYRVRQPSGTAGRGTLVRGASVVRPQTAQGLFEMSRAATGANGASGAGNGTSASVDYDVGVDTVLQEAAAAAAAGGSSYYPGSSYPTEAPYSPPPGETPFLPYEVDTMTVSGDIEEPKEGVMGLIEKNPKYAAAIAALIGFLGYRYAKKRGMI